MLRNTTQMTPKHDKAAGFLRSKLFDGLDSFATLEQRIADLPTRKERGDAERVCIASPFVDMKSCRGGNDMTSGPKSTR